MSENKKALQDWFDSHVIVSGLDKKANKKIKESLKAKLAKDLDKETAMVYVDAMVDLGLGK